MYNMVKYCLVLSKPIAASVTRDPRAGVGTGEDNLQSAFFPPFTTHELSSVNPEPSFARTNVRVCVPLVI